MRTETGNEPDRDLLVQIRNEHARERGLCDLLEQIADGLPGSLDLVVTTPVTIALRTVLKRHIVLHEHFLLPRLVEHAHESETLELFGKQVEAEHIADESLAHDLADELERAAESRHVRNAGMLGYMLYGFFESRRRHLTWEEVFVLPMARRLLDESERYSFCASEFNRLVGAPGADSACRQRICTCGGSADRPTRGKKP